MKLLKQIIIDCVIVLFVFFFALALTGCTPSQEPVQTIINYTDNSQTIQVVGDDNQLTPTTDIQAVQTSTPQQTTENTTEDNMWIFWVIAAGAAVLVYLYQRKRIL